MGYQSKHLFFSFLLCALFLWGCNPTLDDKGDPLDTSADGADGGVAEMETAADSGSGEDSDDDEPATGSDAGVAEPGFRLGNAASDTFYQGSWRAPIKTTSSDPDGHLNCDAGEGWEANAGADMVAHFQSTNQNVYFQHMSWTTLNDNTCDRKNMNALVAAAEEAEASLDIYGSFSARQTKEEYVNAATSMRSLQADNIDSGRVKGMSVDDFHVQLHKVTDSSISEDHLTKAHVGEIYNALHFGAGDDFEDEDSGLEFIPYVASHVIPDYVLPSAILGVRGSGDGSVPNPADYRLHSAGSGLEADRVELSIEFDIPASIPLAGISLNFMHYDAFEVSATPIRDIHLIAELNGAQVYKKSIMEDDDEDKPDMFAEEIELPSTVPLYTSAPNVLRMWLEAEGDAWGPVQNKLAYVWDVHLKAHGAPPVRLHVEDMVFDTFRDPDRPGVTNNDQLVAINNDTWRMDDFVDGVMIKLKATGGSYDSYTHKRFLQSTCGYLRAKGKRCLEAYWGNEQWGKTDFQFDQITDRFENAQRHTDGLVVWRLANELGVPEGGIFTAKEPKDSDYDVMSGFPRYTSATPGWYQNWTITAEEEGDYVLSWWDSGGEDSDATPMGRMMKEAYIDDVKAWDDDVGDTTGTNTTDEDETGTEVFSLEVGEKLTIGLSIVDSFGSTDYLAQFRLTAPSGTIVDLGEGDYASGIDDWGTETMYDCTVAYYTSYDYRDECLRELVAP